jgi:exonuclease 3'-5' domain-containing protein 2
MRNLDVLSAKFYHNIRMYSPDGVLMATVGKKRAQWYLDRDLGEVFNDGKEGFSFKLKFEPNGYGNCNDKFYTTKKYNRCVVCGSTENLTRHHVVPYCFRKFFPDSIKKYSHHDILLVCANCHFEYENEAQKIKMNMIKSCITDEIKTHNANLERIAQTHKILHNENVPPDRKREIRDEICRILEIEKYDEEAVIEFLKQEKFDDFPRLVIDDLKDETDYHNFMVMWRQHFVDYMKPEYLPKYWSVNKKIRIFND